MGSDIGGSMNEMESRLARLEQRASRTTAAGTDVYLDPVTGVSTVYDPLNWTVAANGWEQYTTITPIITDPGNPSYPGGKLTTAYGRAEAQLIGSLCVLTGLVRRKAGASNVIAGIRSESVMFGLPARWRPAQHVPLPCLMGNGNPSGLNSAGTAWVEVRPSLSQNSALVYFVSGTASLNAGSGWVALQGVFPCQVVDTSG